MRENTLKNIRRFFILILMLLSAVACGEGAAGEKTAAFNPDNFLIDVRTQQEFEAGHIKNAVNIPHNQIAEGIKNFVLDEEKAIVIYCQSGKRSEIAEKILKDLGYKNVINAGSYKDLKELEDKNN